MTLESWLRTEATLAEAHLNQVKVLTPVIEGDLVIAVKTVGYPPELVMQAPLDLQGQTFLSPPP